MRIKNAKAEKPTSTRPPLKPHSSPTQFNMHRTVSERQPFFVSSKQIGQMHQCTHESLPCLLFLFAHRLPCSSIFPACFLLFLLSPGSSDIPGQLIFPIPRICIVTTTPRITSVSSFSAPRSHSAARIRDLSKHVPPVSTLHA